MLVDDSGIITVTIFGRSSIPRVGPVCVTRTLSVRATAGGGSAVTLNCTGLPSATESVTAVMVTEFAGGGGLMTVPGMTGPVMAGPVGAVDDAVTDTEAEAAGPTVYPSPSVTDAVIVPAGLVGAVGTVSIAAPDPGVDRDRRRQRLRRQLHLGMHKLHVHRQVRDRRRGGVHRVRYQLSCCHRVRISENRHRALRARLGSLRGHRSYRGRFGNLRPWRRTATSRKRERDYRDQHEQPVRQVRVRENASAKHLGRSDAVLGSV